MKHHTASGHISCLPDPGTGVAERPQIPVMMREGEGSASAWDHESSVLMARPRLIPFVAWESARAAAKSRSGRAPGRMPCVQGFCKKGVRV